MIVNKGGLMGSCAKIYVSSPQMADAFIRECKEQCHNPSAKNLWGKQLISEIMDYCEENEANLNLALQKQD